MLTYYLNLFRMYLKYIMFKTYLIHASFKPLDLSFYLNLGFQFDKSKNIFKSNKRKYF